MNKATIIIVALVMQFTGVAISAAVANSNSETNLVSTERISTTIEFCDALREANGQSLALSTKEAWDQRLAVTKKFTENAPSEQKANAAVYFKLVEDRVALVSQYNYVSVQQLPSDARNKFIEDHQSQQAQANELISYAKLTCNIK
jgi:hypothetical protein